MRKVFLATTGLVAVSVLAAAPASAAEKIKLSLGGFMENWVGYSSQDKLGTVDRTGADVKADTEIHFSGSTKLDNGITVAAVVEMEADHGGGTAAGEASLDDQDAVFVRLSREDLGTLELGSNDNALAQVHHAAPEVGIANQDGDYMNWISAPTNFVDLTTAYADAGKGHGINYISPSFAGLQFAAGYIPDMDSSGGGGNNPNSHTTQSVWAVGLAYNQTYGDLSVGADAGIARRTSDQGSTDSNGENLTIWQGGLSASMAGFTVGGGFARHIEGQNIFGVSGNTAIPAASAVSADGIAWDAGISYATGPYAVSLNYFASETDGTINTVGKDKKQSIMLSGSYNLGPGIDLKGSALKVEYDDETSTAANNNDGWAVVTGIALTF